MSDTTRAHVAWLLWCAGQGYILAEDRNLLENWFLEDPKQLYPADRDAREGWLDMADSVLAAIAADAAIP